MIDVYSQLLTQLGFGGVSGLIVGFAFKKLLKIFLVLGGLFFATLQYLAYIDWIENTL